MECCAKTYIKDPISTPISIINVLSYLRYVCLIICMKPHSEYLCWIKQFEIDCNFDFKSAKCYDGDFCVGSDPAPGYSNTDRWYRAGPV